MSGKLFGVGVGPGDPELLTLKAVRIIQSAPVLAYAINPDGFSYARQVIAAHLRTNQVELALPFSMSPDRSVRQAARSQAAEKVLEYLHSGLDVVFITEGDPLLYSTLQHLIAFLPKDTPVELCPGISAMFAASASAHFPLAVEDQTLLIAPAEKALGHIKPWLQEGRSLVLFKAARWLTELADEVKASGLQCEAILVERASTSGEVITSSLEAWINRDAPYFSLVLLRRSDVAEATE